MPSVIILSAKISIVMLSVITIKNIGLSIMTLGIAIRNATHNNTLF
jgi:hypothetical protein